MPQPCAQETDARLHNTVISQIYCNHTPMQHSSPSTIMRTTWNVHWLTYGCCLGARFRHTYPTWWGVVPFAFPPTAMYMSTMQPYVCIHVLVDPAAFHYPLAQDLLATLPQDHEGWPALVNKQLIIETNHTNTNNNNNNVNNTYIYTHVCTYVYIYTHMYIHMHACMCVYIYIYIIYIYIYHICVYLYLYIYIYICKHICMYVCMYICMHVCMWICIGIWAATQNEWFCPWLWWWQACSSSQHARQPRANCPPALPWELATINNC